MGARIYPSAYHPRSHRAPAFSRRVLLARCSKCFALDRAHEREESVRNAAILGTYWRVRAGQDQLLVLTAAN